MERTCGEGILRGRVPLHALLLNGCELLNGYVGVDGWVGVR